jgi:hypothetical protein
MDLLTLALYVWDFPSRKEKFELQFENKVKNWKYTRRYISLTDLVRGVCCDNQWTCAIVRRRSQEMLHTATQRSIAAKVSASLRSPSL